MFMLQIHYTSDNSETAAFPSTVLRPADGQHVQFLVRSAEEAANEKTLSCNPENLAQLKPQRGLSR